MRFLAVLLTLLSTSLFAQERSQPKVIFFDVNETLLDLQNMRGSVTEALEGRDDLMSLWFSTMLHYSLVDSTTEKFHTFGEIGISALKMVAQANEIPLSQNRAKEAIIVPLRNLPPHPDVREGLAALQKVGYRLISLTNSSNLGVKTQFENAGLTEYFEDRYSVEDISKYKPDLATYRWALEKAQVKPEDAMLVAAHGWDIAGAIAAGMQTAFVMRQGKVLYPLSEKPDYMVSGIDALAEKLVPQFN